MSALTEWFEGRSVDEHYERCNWSRVLTEMACAVLAGIILASLQGCASAPEEKPICAMQFLGHAGNGVPVVKMQCITEEKFQELNK